MKRGSGFGLRVGLCNDIESGLLLDQVDVVWFNASQGRGSATCFRNGVIIIRDVSKGLYSLAVMGFK
jgi:hypothetical protein